MRHKETKGTGIRVLPQDIEAEQSVLEGVLKDPDAMNKVAGIVGMADFYRDSHSKIYEIMFDLYRNGDTTINVSSVSSVAREKDILVSIGGVAYLNTLVDAAPKPADIAHYAEVVREKSLLRQLMKVAENIHEQDFDTGNNVNNYIYNAMRIINQIADKACKP